MTMGSCQLRTLLILLLAALIHRETRCEEFDTDKLLTSLLKKGYRKEVRPRCPDEPAVDLIFDIALRQIIELNEPKQILQTNVWLRVEWTDCRLSWNDTEFGVTSVVLPSTSVWYPDVTLYDSIADEGITAVKEYRIIVTSKGAVRHQLPVVLKSLCGVDTTFFPFDKQSCPLTFGLWAYNGLEVNFTNLHSYGDLESFKGHVEWNVASFEATRSVDYFNNVSYPAVQYTLELRRKPLFFVLSLFFPCVLISLVAILGFLLPPDSGEKVNLEVTVLLSLAVFQLIILEMMPPNSETLPYISIYFATTMILVGLSCFMTVVVLNVHFRGHRGWRVPDVVKSTVIQGLGKMLCVRTRNRNRERHTTNEVVHGVRFEQRTGSMKAVKKVGSGENGDNTVVADTNVLLRHFHRINDSLNDIVSHIRDSEADKDVNDEWHLVALVLDRAFLFTYGFLSLMMLLVFMVKFLNQ